TRITKLKFVLVVMCIDNRCGGKKSYSGPCGGRDCSAGCKCFPEKGARVSLFSLIQFVLNSMGFQYRFCQVLCLWNWF
uniref:Uncharacterized protein n=1 Tax=Amazona collaria TaxID=241587 RepID=A0A8B9GDR6_9PSIT